MHTDETARRFFDQTIWRPNDLEKRALKMFFTNPDKRVFLMHLLPLSVGNVLLSMYSRMKHPHGLRGLFAGAFLPQFLAASLPEVARDFGGDPAAFLKARRILSLEDFVRSSVHAMLAFEEFLESVTTDPDYIQSFCESEKVRKFLRMWLDKYGHNSIARMAGGYWINAEQISILAAKSIEWTRPGSGYIELSTRYVDMAGKELYPIEDELCSYGVDGSFVRAVMDKAFGYYRSLQGANFDGPFPEHLRRTYGSLIANPKDLDAGVFGETCDVLGNFLPAATLTSVGIASSGEALPQLIRHLLLDGTPENRVLAECIMQEGKKLGLDQFLGHAEPTPWQTAAWEYLDVNRFSNALGLGELRHPQVDVPILPPRDFVEKTLMAGFFGQPRFLGLNTMDGVVAALRRTPRNEYDKLPNHFERVAVSFQGLMSFRGWRDLHRQGFCTHYRTHLTPRLGFYGYDKSAPEEFFAACRDIHRMNVALYREMERRHVPAELMQYPLALGNMVGFQVSGNLLQMEFSNWQRSKFSVNHEVRQIFLGFERELRTAYPWWGKISRADTTSGYVFARGEQAVPLPDAVGIV